MGERTLSGTTSARQGNPPRTWRELAYLIRAWGRKGGKRWRARQVRRAMDFVRYVQSRGVQRPRDISPRHARAWLHELRQRGLAEKTLRCHESAVSVVLGILGHPTAKTPSQRI